MVYSTCSILQEENEDIVNQVLNNNLEIVPIKIEGMEQLPLLPSKIKGCLCVKPNELYEGFFIAKKSFIITETALCTIEIYRK